MLIFYGNHVISNKSILLKKHTPKRWKLGAELSQEVQKTALVAQNYLNHVFVHVETYLFKHMNYFSDFE